MSRSSAIVSTNEEPATERLRFAWIITAVFVLLTVPRLLLHELWRDEAWLWLVAIEDRPFADLFAPMARSGHGYLFALLCFLAREVSVSPRALQFLHLVLAGAGTFVFLRWAPFGRLERALFVFGYFPFYEYAVISRDYAIGVLLLWMACAAAAHQRPASLGTALGLLCQTTVYGYLLAIATGAGWLLRRPAAWIASGRRATGGLFAGGVLAVVGAVAGIFQLIPASDTSFASSWYFFLDAVRAQKVLAIPWRGLMPLPRPVVQFWNSNVLDAWPILLPVGALGLLAVALALLWPRREGLVPFCVVGAGLLTFAYIKLIGEVRHHGHWWLLLVAALWLSDGLPPSSWRRMAFLALLALHCAAAAFASLVDLRHPFSNGEATATLLRQRGLDRHPLFGYREPPAASIALALRRPLWSPSREVFATYPDFGPRQRELGPQELRCAARRFAERQGRDIVMVMNRELAPWEELEPVGARRGAIVRTEDYFLYLLRHDRLGATANAARCEAARPP